MIFISPRKLPTTPSLRANIITTKPDGFSVRFFHSKKDRPMGGLLLFLYSSGSAGMSKMVGS